MIRTFNQFLNESNHQNEMSVYAAINEPYTEFINRAQERLDIFKERIQEILHEMDKAIETIVTEFKDVVVGEPIITVDRYFGDVDVKFQTNVPNNDKAWEADESPAQDLEERLSYWIDFKGIRSYIASKPNEDGNCVIELQTYVLDKDNFGEFADAFQKMGEEY